MGGGGDRHARPTAAAAGSAPRARRLPARAPPGPGVVVEAGEQVSASTQNQALAALLFLYRDLLERDLELEGVIRARTRQRIPVVLSEAEVRAGCWLAVDCG